MAALSARERREAISDGVFAYLADHPISTWDALHDGARDGAMEWLDRHREDLVADLAARLKEALADGEKGPEATP